MQTGFTMLQYGVIKGSGESDKQIKKRYFVLISACLLLVLGCSNDYESTPIPTKQNSVLVTYQRSGGIVGLRDQLTIYSDGRCELQRKGVEREFTIQPSQLAHLKELMEEANFLGLKGTYGPPPGADLIEYVISYQAGEGKMHRVRVTEVEVPDALQPILNELNQLISSNS